MAGNGQYRLIEYSEREHADWDGWEARNNAADFHLGRRNHLGRHCIEGHARCDHAGREMTCGYFNDSYYTPCMLGISITGVRSREEYYPFAFRNF